MIDLGLGACKKEKSTLNQTAKSLVAASSASEEIRKRKKDFIDSFRSLRKLVIEMIIPTEHDAKDKKERATSADSISAIEINFSRLTTGSCRSSDDCDSCVESAGSLLHLTQEAQTKEDGVTKEHACVENEKNKFKLYQDKIVKKVTLSVHMKMYLETD